MKKIYSSFIGQRDSVIAAYLFAFNLLYGLIFINLGLDILDDGFILDSIKRFMNGGVLYKDIFTMYAPMKYHLISGFLKIFGLNLYMERLYGLIIGSFLIVCVYYTARQICKSKTTALISTLLVIFLFRYGVSDRLIFAFVAILSLMRYFRLKNEIDQRSSILFAFIVGLLIGLQVVTSPEVGAYLLASVAVYLTVKLVTGAQKAYGFLQLVLFAGIGCMIIVIPVAYSQLHAAYKETIYLLITWPLTIFPKTMSLTYPNLIKSIAMIARGVSLKGIWKLVNCILFYIPVVIYLITSFQLAISYSGKTGKRSRSDADVLLILLFGILLYKTATVRSDIGHLMFGIIPAIILGCYLIEQAYEQISLSYKKSEGSKRGLNALIAAAVVILIAYGQIGNAIFLKQRLTGELVPLGLKGADNIFVNKEQKKDLVETVEFVKRNTLSRDKIFAFPYGAMIYFLSGRDYPGRYNQVLPYNTASDQAEIVNALKRNPPKLVIYLDLFKVNDKEFRSYGKLVDDYIKSNFRVSERFGKYEIWTSTRYTK